MVVVSEIYEHDFEPSVNVPKMFGYKVYDNSFHPGDRSFRFAFLLGCCLL